MVGVPVSNPEVQEKHRSLFGGHSSGKAGGQHHTININAARLGQIVIESTARGFGFTLGMGAKIAQHGEGLTVTPATLMLCSVQQIFTGKRTQHP